MSLFISIEKGDLHGVLRRIKSGASFTLLNKHGQTPLHRAAELGNEAIIRALIEGGAPIDALSLATGETPLHEAAKSGANAVKPFIDVGAAVDVYDYSNLTPLHIAADLGDATSVAILIDHGAEIDAPAEMGETALDFARQSGYLDVVELLLDRGAETHGWPREDVITDCLAYRGFAEVCLERQTGDPLGLQLIEAVGRGDQTGVRLALDRGADVNIVTPQGESPLALAANRANHEIISLLIEAGSDVSHRDADGATCLHAAAEIDDDAASAILISAGADVNARMDGITPLQVAVNVGSRDIVRALVAAGADTRGMTESELLAELVRKEFENSSIYDWDRIDHEPDLAKRLPDLRLPLSMIGKRFFDQIKAQAFAYFGCYAISDVEEERPIEIFAFVSEKHKAYALLFDETGTPGVWLNYISTFKDGTSFWLSNCTERQWLPCPKAVEYEIEALNDAIALLESFLCRRPNRAAVRVSRAAFQRWLERSLREWEVESPDVDDFDPEAFEAFDHDDVDEDDSCMAYDSRSI